MRESQQKLLPETRREEEEERDSEREREREGIKEKDTKTKVSNDLSWLLLALCSTKNINNVQNPRSGTSSVNEYNSLERNGLLQGLLICGRAWFLGSFFCTHQTCGVWRETPYAFWLLV